MKHAVLVRTYYESHVFGNLYCGDLALRSIERPWLNNERNISCIPEGEYLCKYVERSASGRYKKVYHLQDVPGRSGILGHSGNLVKHSSGCILWGKKFGRLAGQPAVLNSRSACTELVNYMEQQDFILHIVGG